MRAHDRGTPEEVRRPDRHVSVDEPARHGLEEVLALQRSVGNQATSRLIAPEHQDVEPEATPVQRSEVDEVVSGGGSSLPPDVRTEVKEHTGVDLAGVRVHTDTAAARSAQRMGARAYTTGKDMVFTPGSFNWHTLFHEAKHVEQQEHGPVAGTDRGDGVHVSDPGDDFEQEAEATAIEASRAQASVQTAPALALPSSGSRPQPHGGDCGHDHGPSVQRATTVQRASPDTAAREEMQGRMRARDAELGISGPPVMAEDYEEVQVEGTGLTYDEVLIRIDLMGSDARAEPVARPAPEYAPPDQNALRDQYGMPVENQEWFQNFANSMELSIYVRPTNPASVGWLRGLAVPKPMSIKAKTVNKLDVKLGASSTTVGLVGYFQPVLPPKGAMTDAEWAKLQERHNQRQQEYDYLQPAIARLEQQGILSVYKGVLGIRKGTEGEFWPITGDHDVFDIRHKPAEAAAPVAGEPIKEPKLSKEAYEASVRLMTKEGKGVMHGAHMRWEPQTEQDVAMFNKIVTDHLQGGEPLIRFSPNAAPQLVWAP